MLVRASFAIPWIYCRDDIETQVQSCTICLQVWQTTSCSRAHVDTHCLRCILCASSVLSDIHERDVLVGPHLETTPTLSYLPPSRFTMTSPSRLSQQTYRDGVPEHRHARTSTSSTFSTAEWDHIVTKACKRCLLGKITVETTCT